MAHGLAVHLVVGLNVRRFAVSHASVLSWIRKLVHKTLFAEMRDRVWPLDALCVWGFFLLGITS